MRAVCSPPKTWSTPRRLEPNSSAALMIWEDLWAAEFADALRASGGVVLEGGRIPFDLWEAALAAGDE